MLAETTEWNDEANQVFLAAMELPTPHARTIFLQETCGSRTDIREHVEQLLRANESIGDFLERPLCQLLTSPPIPATAGPYKLLEPLGEGGMGIVYLALQESPVRRQVALKVIKPGMDSRQVISRFEAERQALALMDHPNIARVLDAGTTENGRPYFAMELVHGIPITKYCQQKQLPRTDRLGLFLEVCLAVSHAHQKGIIHRDLKPSNILVSEQAGKPAVKVIDFGVAKAMGQSLTDRTLQTGFTQIIGTPVYMSPEQSMSGSVDIDTRSDVYSLGVLLYELLTGTTPFSEEDLQKAGPDTFRQMIQNTDPPRPSVRVNRLSEADLSVLGAHDPASLRRLSFSLRGELDWIVMQAMEKDRNRRYESVSELAADVERYLNVEPVRACPPTTWYLLSKLTYRHRAALSTGVLMLLAILVGMAVAVWQAVVAVDARNLAEERYQHSQAALKVASIARRRANEERDKARASSEHANRLLYAGDIHSSMRAWQHNDVRKMHELLSRHIPTGDQSDLRGFEWHFLWHHTRLESTVVFQSDHPLYCVRVSPDGKTVAVTGADGQIHLLSSGTYNKLATLVTQHGEVNSVEFSPDGTELVSAGDDGRVVIWNLATRQPGLSLQAYDKAVYNALFADESILTCGNHPDVRLWNRQTGALERELITHEEAVQSIARSPNGILAAGSEDFSVSAWDRNQTVPIWHDVHDSPAKVNAVAFDARSSLLAVGRANGLLSLRSPYDGKLMIEQQLPDSIHSLAFSPTIGGTPLSWLAIGDRGGSLHLMAMNDIAARSGLTSSSPEYFSVRQLQGHVSRVYSLAFTPDVGHLLSAGEDGQLRAWNLSTEHTTRPLGSDIEDFAWIDNDRVVSIGKEFRIHDLRDSQGQPKTFRLGGDEGGIFVKYHAETDRIIYLDDSHRLMSVSPAETEQLLIRPRGGMEEPQRFAISPDGQRIALVIEQDSSRWLEILDTPQSNETRAKAVDRPVRKIPCESVVHNVEFSSDGNTVLLDQAQDLRQIRIPSLELAALQKVHRSTIENLAISQDGRHIATASKDRQVKIWEWPSGREIWSVMAHAIGSSCVAFSPDGKTLATCGEDRLLRLWRWKEDLLVLEYPLADWPATKMEFNSTGDKLIILSRKRLRLYDSASRGKATR